MNLSNFYKYILEGLIRYFIILLILVLLIYVIPESNSFQFIFVFLTFIGVIIFLIFKIFNNRIYIKTLFICCLLFFIFYTYNYFKFSPFLINDTKNIFLNLENSNLYKEEEKKLF